MIPVNALRSLRIFFALFAMVIFIFNSCRESPIIYPPPGDGVTDPEYTSLQGFYLLNEGNMGSNKATLDYFEYKTGIYFKNIYAYINPTVPKELGDVGNDIAIYGSKMYAVINCSHKVEVMEAKTAKRIGQINIENCRNIAFYNGFAYVTSYAVPVGTGQEQIGYVAKIDTLSLQMTDKCMVGFQPDGIAISNRKIYVANSGGYLFTNTENRVSVIDASNFKEIKTIQVATNLNRACADKHGNVWVSAQGDFFGTSSKLYCIDTHTDLLTDSIDIPVSNFHLDDENLYIIGTIWNYASMSNEISYGIVNVVSKQVVANKIISDGTEASITMPYSITVNPITKDIYITDAKNHVYPGTLFCFDKDGKLKWETPTGVIPGHFTFLE